MKTLKRTERGWPAHFCAVSKCTFRRNTLLEVGSERVVVSTVGNMQSDYGPAEEIGVNRYYETMAFKARKEGPYWEADIGNEVPFKSKWAISKCEFETDSEANEMHEKVCAEIAKKMLAPKKETQP